MFPSSEDNSASQYVQRGGNSKDNPGRENPATRPSMFCTIPAIRSLL